MAHDHVESRRAEHLHRGAGGTVHRFRLRQSAAFEETIEIDVDAMRTDTVAANNKLSGAGFARIDGADIDRIERAAGVDRGDIGARTRLDRRQAGRQHDVGHHVGQVEQHRRVLDRDRDLEEFLQRLDTAIDDDHARNGLTARRRNDDDIGTAAGAAAHTAAAATAATAGADPAATAAAAIADARR